MTNIEKIKAKSTERMAELFIRIALAEEPCEYCTKGCENLNNEDRGISSCLEFISKWLESEAEENESR